MTVAELINELNKMPQDATVSVKYRDEGGIYYGCDYDCTPILMESDYNGVEKGTVVL